MTPSIDVISSQYIQIITYNTQPPSHNSYHQNSATFQKFLIQYAMICTMAPKMVRIKETFSDFLKTEKRGYIKIYLK